MTATNLHVPDKQNQYARLVEDRKACCRCIGLHNPGSQNLHVFDSHEIGPWTRLHGDLDAELMIVGQDWGDRAYYEKNKGMDDLSNPTMRTLERLLNGIGVDIRLTTYEHGDCGLFLTNAILCLKGGGLQGNVTKEWFDNCGQYFLKQQIEIVSPKVVVTLGQLAYVATMRAFDLAPQRLRDAVDRQAGDILKRGTTLVAAYHCGNRVLNTHRPFDQQQQDWKRVKHALGLVTR